MRSVALLVAAFIAAPLAAQQTTPERTGNRETSSHADVLAFLDSLERAGAGIRVRTLGVSPEGRRLPLVIAARPMVESPGEAHRTGKPIVYVQGNIHAGEVEGKEALQMLLRDLTVGPLRTLLDSVIVLAVPIYNADGNDQFGPGETNRPGQNGPAVVGRRANGQGLDLNRDYVKAEAPETRASTALLNAWDPDIFIDLHTTNGSYHGYALTWAPGLHPDPNPSNDYARDRFLPAIRERMRTRHHQETFPYGNFRNQEPDSLIQGWETYDYRPRYGTNWIGLRGRIAILSEAYSNAPFGERISATYNFVREILSLAAEERATIKARNAAPIPADSVTIRAVLAPATRQAVIAEITKPAGDGGGPFAHRTRTGEYRTITMPVYDRFAPARREAVPAGYLLPPSLGHVAELLGRQGVTVERLAAPWRGAVEQFRVDSIVVERYVFEGHRTLTVEGAWVGVEGAVTAGWYYVPTAQRLGRFAAYLLEPGSEDGVITWNSLDRSLRRGQPAPVWRVRTALMVPRIGLPDPLTP
jgi:zinc carboxypeptidase